MKFAAGFVLPLAVCASLATGSALASPVNGTGDLVSNVIFGSGNANGSFTGVTVDNLELALRGKISHQGVYNYNGNNLYTFDPTTYPGTSTRSAYNFEWSINTSVDGSGADTIGSFDYLLQIDTDPTYGTSFISGDPYAIGGDHSFGTNSTPQSGGLEATSISQYADFLAQYYVSQQSWNMGFGDLNGGSPYLSNVQQQGLYTISLTALKKGTDIALASTSINIQYGDIPGVPLPAALPMALGAFGGFGGLAFLRRRRRKA